MPVLINLVATRSTDGDHASLFRWYNDHVHLLMGCDALDAATLYRRQGPDAAAGPEYMALYEFASHAAFMVFETSDARARAQAVVRDGWARTGIEILQRTQYERLGARGGSAVADTDHQVAVLDLGAGSRLEAARWLNDRMHTTWPDPAGERAWHRAWGATDAGGDALVLAQGADAQAAGPALRSWQDGPSNPDFGLRPASVQVRWQAAYRRLCRWAR